MEPSRGRAPTALIGMIVLVSAIEFALSRDPLRFTDNTSLNWRLAVDDVAREAATTEVACLGDSLTKNGVVPAVLRAGTGKRTYNFAMARSSAQATYLVFRRLIEAGGRPSALVVDFKSSLQSERPRFALRHFQEVASLREAWELAREDGRWSLLPPFLLGQLLPSTRYRLEIRESILCTLGGQAAPTISMNRLALRNWTANQGTFFNASQPHFRGETPPPAPPISIPVKWKCHRINRRSMDRLFDLAAAHSVPVYWVIPPFPPEVQERSERIGQDDSYTEFARSMLARHPGVTIVDGRHSGYANPTFADSTHLNGRGAMALSHELAAILNRPKGRPRWIELPAYRDWEFDAPVEDLDQSRVAVAAGTSRR